jgi:hypothetical protein
MTKLNKDGLIDLENMTQGEVYLAQREAQQKSIEQAAERETHLATNDAEFTERMELVEYQIGTWVKPYIRDTITMPLWGLAAAAGVYFVTPDPWKFHALFVAWIAYCVFVYVFKRIEHKKAKARIIKRQERSKEPTAKEREVDIFFGGDERMTESDKDRDWFRRHLLIDEKRFRDRYGYVPNKPD